IYLTIIWYASEDYRNWIIPFVALLTVAILFYTYTLINQVDLPTFWIDNFNVGFNFNYFDNVYQNIGLYFFATVAEFFTVYQLTNLISIATNQVTLYKDIVLCFILDVTIVILTPEESYGLLVFSFFPLSRIGGNFIAKRTTYCLRKTVLTAMLAIRL